MPLNARRFRAPFIRPERAWAEADRFRATYWPSAVVPVEVEEILWKVNLRLEPILSLKEDADVDALLRGDLTTIIVDADGTPERKFLQELYNRDHASKVAAWLKNTPVGFYSIEYAWKKGEHPKRGEFSPKQGDWILVVEIKYDRERKTRLRRT